MKEIKILCHTCDGKGYILEQPYEEGMIAIRGTIMGTIMYIHATTKKLITVEEQHELIIHKEKVVCPECDGKGNIDMEVWGEE